MAAPRHFAEPAELAAEPAELVVLLVELVAAPAGLALAPAGLALAPVGLALGPARLLLQNHRPLLEPLVRNHRLLHRLLESRVGFQQPVALLALLLEEIPELAVPAGFAGQPAELLFLGQCPERPELILAIVGRAQRFAVLGLLALPLVGRLAPLLRRFRRGLRQPVRCQVVPRGERLGLRLGRLRIRLPLHLPAALVPALRLPCRGKHLH